MTAAEPYYGAAKSKQAEHNNEIVEAILLTINIIHSDRSIVRAYGEIKANLQRGGLPIADADLFIAATAITKWDKLVTGNIKHYERIEDLATENRLR